ncbi:MAG: LPS export ABC transporter periplasmic protein LptC [Spirosomataceae bacterium]
MKRCFLACLFLAGCTDVPPSQEKQSTYNGPLMEVHQVSVMLSDSGKTSISLTTARQLKMQNEDEVYPKTVYVTFFDDLGVPYSTLRGDSARFVKSENLYRIMGNVFFYNRTAQQSLASELLLWNPVTRRIYTDKKVTINTPTEKMVGIGMEADQDFTQFQMKRVTGIFQVDSLITQPPTSASAVSQ